MITLADNIDAGFLKKVLLGKIEQYNNNELATGYYQAHKQLPPRAVSFAHITVRHPTFDESIIDACLEEFKKQAGDFKLTLSALDVFIGAGKFGWEVKFEVFKYVARLDEV
ncbi:hypothetical protein OBP_075 [Pseudomonas phage OBP]|uniref:hypothetical protein n=1 Tax=Pseudomonas phage OBP TaxID=1124849 RepID=UPI000240D429|nr:hypothetical protein OBP_075 [Pseudomonas phage OBP]AEV89512.1 hypothetical protein OBP_075 [Pseudomonas phage OBP]